jgi:hypothetical protein
MVQICEKTYGSEGSEQLLMEKDGLKTVDHTSSRCDGGSTQVGGGTSQGKPTSTSRDIDKQLRNEEKRDEVVTGPMIQCPFSFPSNGPTLRLEDLFSFQQSLEKPLVLAHQALECADHDLRQSLEKIFEQVFEVVQSTDSVVKAHGMLSQRILYEVLPQFKHAITHADANAEANHTRILQMVISRMKNDAKAIRASYLNALDAVQYLIACTQVSLDFYECSDEVQTDTATPALLRSALQELKHVHHKLADPSDFWLIFHIVELQLGRIEESSQHILQTLGARHPSSVKAQEMCWQVCGSIEQLCSQYFNLSRVAVAL